MASSVLSILVGLCLITCFVAAETEPYVPALYVFGDSLVDAGNNNYIPNCTARADHIPFGASLPFPPTGRFTDGLTALDFLANCLGIQFSPPYLQPGANFATGINFASGGSGLLDSTGAESNVMSMNKQVSLFEEYSGNRTEAELAKSLFAIVVGSNDIANYFSYIFEERTLQDFNNLLLSKLDDYIMRLYNRGARKFIVMNIPPLGCTPIARYMVYISTGGQGCLDSLNTVVTQYNSALRSNLTQLDEKLDEGTIIQLNVYDYIMNVIYNGEPNGLKNTTWACCPGSGEFGTIPACGDTDPQDLYCSDPSTYVFWDGGHGTQKIYKLFSEQIWSGNTSVAYPINVSTLVSGETCLISNDAPTLSDM